MEKDKQLRSPICSVMGHVDHGKSSILDNIRDSKICAGEAGAITQAIGASIIPLETLKKKCGTLLTQAKMKFTIPGLLFIDTPGHAAFTNLRRRGGNLADIAILVVDINEGFKPQTKEALEILKSYKTPFLVAANKIDLLPRWKSAKGSVIANLNLQTQDVITSFESKLYEVVGQIHDVSNMQSDRFDRVHDYTQQIAIVPCSAKTGEGLSELMMVLAGLAQKFLEKNLEFDVDGPAKGTVLEVKESKGLGFTCDTIIYDGTLKVNDTIVIGSLEEPVVTKVKALLEPEPNREIRDKKGKFRSVKQVKAAMGVKISAPDLDKVVSGMPLRACDPKDIENVREEIKKEVDEIVIETDKEGILIKADSIGSLEAMVKLLQERDIPIRKASVGEITKSDLIDAHSNYERNPLYSVILGFNIKKPDEKLTSSETEVTVFVNDVIYRLLDAFEEWVEKKKKEMEAQELEKLVRPCKIEFLRNCTFRQSSPAIIGVEVLSGVIKTGTQFMKSDGTVIGFVKSMQKDKDNVQRAEKGDQIALSIDGVTVGRQIDEDDLFYSMMPEPDFREMKKLKKHLSKGEVETAKEIAEIMRKGNSLWGL